MKSILRRTLSLGLLLCLFAASSAAEGEPARTLRVFIFAGQSNMVGSHSNAKEIDRFPPFRGLDQPQPDVRFHYCTGREDKNESDGWVDLQPIRGVFGPELSFAREVARQTKDPVAIIKVATGGTTLGKDWNPDEPGGLRLYPLALQRVRDALDELDRKRVTYSVEGVMWHQGENDMFDADYKAAYADNLANFIACWRRDLELPELPFFIGELCTKSVWGMDHRANMDAIDRAQRAVTAADPLATYVPTSHVAVKIGGDTGLHYHYGTLGQLEHGISHAEAYLQAVGQAEPRGRLLKKWPYREGSKVKLFVLAGHRNMEGERAFVADLQSIRGATKLAQEQRSVAYRYSVGGGYRVSGDWEPLAPAGFCGTFGPELSFAAELERGRSSPFAIAKFTHSGSQVIDWTPNGSEAPARNLYPAFIAFIRESKASLEARGHVVELAGVVYHLGENDTAWGPFRRTVADRLAEAIAGSREDLGHPNLRWFVSQQEPMPMKSSDAVDVVAAVEAIAAADAYTEHVLTLELPGREEALVLTTAGVVELGRRLAERVLAVDAASK